MNDMHMDEVDIDNEKTKAFDDLESMFGTLDEDWTFQ